MAFRNRGHGPSGPTTRPGGGLHLRALNVERGSDRYPTADDISPPRIAHWRCNLTALSQRRNLLFVACSHQIYVWEPAGASQTLGRKPGMIINPVMKEPRGIGYIRPAFPHEINSILVDDLGREEVLLLATDSGNVCGYRVEAIFSALKRATESGKTRPVDGAEVMPFFLEYVGASAWGLAIHKYARLIAVSANSELVTVFAFALVNPASGRNDDTLPELAEDDEFTDVGQTWLDVRTDEQLQQLKHLMPGQHRTRNIKLSYAGHFSNIPSVSFLNCDLDPNGTWMVSTDIENKVLVWKVWEDLGPFNIYYFNQETYRSFPNTLRSDDRGWSVIALDPRSFQLLKSTEEACGGQPQRREKDGQTVLDLTKVSSKIPDASRIYNYFPPAVRSEPEEIVLPDFFSTDSRVQESSNAQEKRDFRAAHASAVTSSFRHSDSIDAFSHQAVDGSSHADNMSEDDTDGDPENQASSAHELQEGLADLDDANNIVQTGHEPLTLPHFIPVGILEALGGDIHEVEALLGETLAADSDEGDHFLQDQAMDRMEEDDNDDDDDSVDSDEISDQEGTSYHIFDPPTNSNFPILHFSHTDIRIIPHPYASDPSVVCGCPLAQSFARPLISLRGFDRFNMVKYIPEHGIVVAASQKGRAAVIALTESRATGKSLRIDWIVPLESQEKYGERPLVPLLGMSVSPMQGFEFPPDVPYIPGNGDSNNSSNNSNGSLEFQYQDTTRAFSTSASIQGRAPSTPNLTLPESHARASRAYQPEESWRGWNPSRRYRLLLIYMDHTVMSYEFWYTWNFSSESGKRGGYDGVVGSEDDYLIL
ncbi:hypothetical protein BJX61DRAFT_492799 [Aspergillus egyptiacus]|nr:hypothetical protein BJX61DRAFT_492799 [Aspergillus egyptiacus]